jgi:release factor glutamine methyltransferase
MTRSELVTELAATLGASHEARFIVQEVLGSSPPISTSPVEAADVQVARSLAARRGAGEPLQYLLGHWAFRTVDLLVDPRVLIPRPETEQVVEVALQEVRLLNVANPTVVDAGTGSGAIALAMATELTRQYPTGQVWATDASADALEVATANLDRVRVQHNSMVLPVTFVQGSWLHPLPSQLKGSIDVIVSNPPYVDASEWAGLPPDVRCEPRSALVAAPGSDGTPGLGDIEAVLTQAWTWLSRPGAVVIELAPHQADHAIAMARDIGYGEVRVEPDLSDRPRAFVGQVA